MNRPLRFFQAIHEATDLAMASDPSVYIMGIGVPDPKGVFGTTLGLHQRHGANRVMDMPCSENAMTGVTIGSALVGMRPILVHQRIDFALLGVEQMVNQAAKWHYMFGGQLRVPLVVRVIIGRGWGQGPQHAQSLQAWFAHIPGLKVVMPATAYSAKGLLLASIADNNPVIFIESRWLYNTLGDVPEGLYQVPLGQAKVMRPGTDVTIVAMSYMVAESLRAAECLTQAGIEAEVIDLQTLRPLDRQTILASVRKTGRLVMADTGGTIGGFGAEIVAMVAEEAGEALTRPPRRLGMPDCPIPTSPFLSVLCYPTATDVIDAVAAVLGVPADRIPVPEQAPGVPADVPHSGFTGPF